MLSGETVRRMMLSRITEGKERGPLFSHEPRGKVIKGIQMTFDYDAHSLIEFRITGRDATGVAYRAT